MLQLFEPHPIFANQRLVVGPVFELPGILSESITTPSESEREIENDLHQTRIGSYCHGRLQAALLWANRSSQHSRIEARST